MPELVEDEVVSATLPAGFAQSSRVVDALSFADRCLVIDVSNLAYRANFAYARLSTKTGQPSGHIYGALRLYLATLQNHAPAGRWLPVFCYDGPGAKAERQGVLPAYKANRDSGRFNPCPDVERVLRHLPGLHVKCPKREGDDAIAWAAENLKKPVLILSGDRDLHALLSLPNVSIYSPNLKRNVTLADVESTYCVKDPYRIYFAKALFGDSSDNIPGVERLIKKQIAPHLNIEGELTPERFYDAVDLAPMDVTSLKTKLKLADSKAQVAANLQVILPRTTGFDRTTVERVTSTQAGKDAFRAELEAYECHSLVARAHEFFGGEFFVNEET